jgi:hypothetical protein
MGEWEGRVGVYPSSLAALLTNSWGEMVSLRGGGMGEKKCNGRKNRKERDVKDGLKERGQKRMNFGGWKMKEKVETQKGKWRTWNGNLRQKMMENW